MGPVSLNTLRLSAASCCLLLVTSVSFDAFSQAPRGLAPVRPEVLSGRAQLVGPMPPARPLRFSLVLALRNQAELSTLLQRLYDPSSADYHHFLSVADFTRRFAPSQSDYQAALDFALSSGFEIDTAPANRLVIPVRATVAQTESAFHVRMNLYRHPTENRVFFSPDREPSPDLATPLAHIAGLNDFSLPTPLARKPSALTLPHSASFSGSGPSGSFFPGDMRAAYYGGASLTGAGQTLALVEFDGYRLDDVNLTLAGAGLTKRVPIRNVLLDGVDGTPARGDDAEEVLDIVQAIGMAPGLSAVRVYIGASDADILDAIAADGLAQQVSISWTWTPDDPAANEQFFMEMAAQGQSVFAASGDSGEFDPLIDNFYPAEDAYVTTVGGTLLTTTGPEGTWSAETAWTYSGGGVSPDGVSIPPWQSGIANSANGASTSLRNVPDVAMESGFDNYLCDMGACSAQWGGTSFAAPRWAAFTALVNQQAASSGRSPVGLLGPALFAIGHGSASAAVFHDITLGNNNAENGCCGQPYFNAVPGYDLVTGWGSPAGQGLIDALAPPAAPSLQITASAGALSISPGNSATAVITAHGPAPVDLAVSGLPGGVAASWSENPAATTSVLTLSVGSNALRGTSLLTITGTCGSVSARAHLALRVDAPGFTLLPGRRSVQLYPGVSADNTITVTRYAGFTGSVNLAVTSTLPSGVTASWLNNPAADTSALTFTADGSAAPAQTMVTITGMSGPLTATTTVALSIGSPRFLLNVSPYPLALGQGDSQSTTVTVVPVGRFSEAVAITSPQLPQGVTASVSPATTTGATLTLTAASTAAMGSWPATIRGTAANSSSDAQFLQSIISAGVSRFTLAASPAYLSVPRGASATANFTIDGIHGFSFPVLLLVSNLPDGVTASWSRNPASAATILTLAASTTAPAEPVRPVFVDGISGKLTAQAILYLSVEPAPGFSLSPSPALLQLQPGASVASAINVIPQSGFSHPVSFAVISALPSGVTASLTTKNGTATLLLAAAGSAAPGAFSLVVAGTASGQSVTASIPVSILPVTPVPVIGNISPPFAAAGTSAFSVTINGSGFTPTSIARWNDSPIATQFVSPTQISAQVTGADGSQAGVSALTVADPSGSSSAPFQFEIDSADPRQQSPPAFASSSATVSAGQSASYPVAFTPNVSSATAACLNLPAGSSCAYSASPSSVTISTSAASPKGSYVVTVVFTETLSGTSAALLLHILLLPYLLLRSRLSAHTVRAGDCLSIAVLAVAVISACSGTRSSPVSDPPPGTTRTVTSSGAITLTIQ